MGEVGVAFGPELSGDTGQIAAASSVSAKSFAIIVGPSRDASGRGLGGARTRSCLAFTAANPSAVEALAIICESVFQAGGNVAAANLVPSSSLALGDGLSRDAACRWTD